MSPHLFPDAVIWLIPFWKLFLWREGGTGVNLSASWWFSNFSLHQNHAEGLWRHRLPAPPAESLMQWVEWGPRTHISNKFPGNVDGSSPASRVENHCPRVNSPDKQVGKEKPSFPLLQRRKSKIYTVRPLTVMRDMMCSEGWGLKSRKCSSGKIRSLLSVSRTESLLSREVHSRA